MTKFEEVISFNWSGVRYAIPGKSAWIVLPNGQVLSALHWDSGDPENKTVALKLEYAIDMTIAVTDLKMVALGLTGVLAEEVADLVELFADESKG